jgi:hypothetical protein
MAQGRGPAERGKVRGGPPQSAFGRDRADSWYAVRCIFGHPDNSGRYAYEERITIWRARSMASAIELAEAEAGEYVEDSPARYLGFAQCFSIWDRPRDGGEVFSLIRLSDLNPEQYLDKYFDTGDEFESKG